MYVFWDLYMGFHFAQLLSLLFLDNFGILDSESLG